MKAEDPDHDRSGCVCCCFDCEATYDGFLQGADIQERVTDGD